MIYPQVGHNRSSLVRVPTKLAVPHVSSWSPKARRWYQRVLSGVTHQRWLSRNWAEIHNSPIVYIQKMRFKRKRLVNYLMKHYLPAHDHGGLYTRMSWSWGWVFRGFCGAWKWFWKQGPTMYEAIIEWNKLMRRSNPLISYKRMRGLLYISKPLTFYM